MNAPEVLDMIYHALRRYNVPEINDVTMDRGLDKQRQLVLTTDDGKVKQVWILDAQSLLETDTPEE